MRPRRAVAVARPLVAAALDDHAHRRQVVDLVELAALLGHLVVDRVEVLRAPRDLGRDVDLVELLLQHHRRLAHVLLAVGAPLGDHLLDLLVLAGMQRLEREVLELPLERVDAEAVRERRVDLERLARLLELLLLAEVLDRAQVVQAVGELDQDDPQVLGHRDDQLPVVLGLRVLAALELDAGQLGDALDERARSRRRTRCGSRRSRCRCPRRRRAAARRRASPRRAAGRRGSSPRPTGGR